ncbi:C40 family peptidase [Alkaliphilus peptidifermentans]|uniref:Permuted papain-like amidase enzyme, YaeF/YiiX, C92 family n=1 Tax=Alkaliphilus peptidifermentans DSM 18978 TaxID=1120976 RepID=A0A1G5JPP1_9FIRM|nr:hypothetical protein [Alkaliphilus peptidifermentans]SCY90353.1 hypothetical protein SAMN03080606_02955 [Alkaliphilus peptidifermentans DSM 18978]
MEKIKKIDLFPGDILLCRGKGWISDLIVLFDGGTYSHTAVYVGERCGEHLIIQATSDGVVCTPIEDIKTETFTDVYRFNKNGHKLGDDQYPYNPVIDVCQKYADSKTKYAFSHLILLAILSVTREIPLDYTTKKIIRSILDDATAHLFKLIDNKTTPMVCSEVAYRAFDEADNNRKYQLSIEGITLKKIKEGMMEASNEIRDISNSNADLAVIDIDLYNSKQRFVDMWSKLKEEENTLYSIPLNPIAPCVTPKDLEKSRNLIKIGELEF